jgi:hypothetical protein
MLSNAPTGDVSPPCACINNTKIMDFMFAMLLHPIHLT